MLPAHSRPGGRARAKRQKRVDRLQQRTAEETSRQKRRRGRPGWVAQMGRDDYPHFTRPDVPKTRMESQPAPLEGHIRTNRVPPEAFPSRPFKPRDVPQYRDKLLRDWSPSGTFPELARAIARASGGRHAFSPGWELNAARNATLWYVSSEMSELLDASAPSLPATPLTVEEIPEPYGLVLFETPLLGLDAETGERTTHTSAYLWGPANIEGIDVLNISTYMFLDMTAGAPHLARHIGATEREPRLVPTGMVTWKYGQAAHEYAPFPVEGSIRYSDDVDEIKMEEMTTPPPQAHASMVEDRRRVMGLWVLSAMPRLTDVKRDTINRAHVKRSQRANPPQDPAIRVVTLRAKPAPGADEVPDGGRVYRHRWVTRGHFWNQPYGPNHSLRRVAYRNPALKGPKNAPFLVGEKVRAWTKK